MNIQSHNVFAALEKKSKKKLKAERDAILAKVEAEKHTANFEAALFSAPHSMSTNWADCDVRGRGGGRGLGKQNAVVSSPPPPMTAWFWRCRTGVARSSHAHAPSVLPPERSPPLSTRSWLPHRTRVTRLMSWVRP